MDQFKKRPIQDIVADRISEKRINAQRGYQRAIELEHESDSEQSPHNDIRSVKNYAWHFMLGLNCFSEGKEPQNTWDELSKGLTDHSWPELTSARSGFSDGYNIDNLKRDELEALQLLTGNHTQPVSRFGPPKIEGEEFEIYFE